MKVNKNATLIFAGILLFFGISTLYSGIETCDFCPFQETLRGLFSLVPVNSIGFIFFAPIFLGMVLFPSFIQIVTFSVIYGIIAVVIAGIIYARYEKEIFLPMKIYAAFGMIFILAMATLPAFFNQNIDFGTLFQIIISILIGILFYSYFLSGIILFVSNDILKHPWKSTSLKNKIVLFLAVTFVEYILFRLAMWTLFSAAD